MERFYESRTRTGSVLDCPKGGFEINKTRGKIISKKSRQEMRRASARSVGEAKRRIAGEISRAWWLSGWGGGVNGKRRPR